MQITKVPSHNFGHRGDTKITHIVIHAMLGTMAGTAAVFKSTRFPRVSAHYGVGRDGGVVQYVDDQYSAWHVCNANPFCLGIEHEDMWIDQNSHKTTGGCMSRMIWTTSSQLAASAELTANLMTKHSIAIENVIGHNDPSLRRYGNNHQDPGPTWDMHHYKQLVQEFLLKPAVSTSPADLKPVVTELLSQPIKGGRPKKIAG